MKSAGKISNIIGMILTIFISLFLLFDGVMKIVQPKAVIDATRQMNFPISALLPIGIVLIACTLLYLLTPTAILGALLLTAYLGGAVAAQVVAGPKPFELVFPILSCVLIWISMLLRERRLRVLLPIRRRNGA